MTFFQLARKNAWRKPMRTTLLIVCIATAFLIYGLTASFVNGSQGSAGSSEDILGVMNAAGMAQSMPIAYQPRIAADPAVVAVAYTSRIRGFIEQERNAVTVSAVEPSALLAANGDELGLTTELIEKMGPQRNRILVGQALARARDWRVGQTIAITAFNPIRNDGNRDLQFEIAGIFDGKNANTDTYFIIARYDYVNALRTRNKDTADVFIVRPRPGAAVSELAARLDATFANSAAPTRTQSERQFLDAFIRQYADIVFIVNVVVGTSFVTLLMIITTTMAVAVRERYFEIGVLKTLGFSRTVIVNLIMGEALILFAAGGAIGLLLTECVTMLSDAALGLVLSAAVCFKSAGIVLVLALVTGCLPAFNAMRIPVVAAFRTR